MSEASLESIESLIEKSESNLAQIEVTLPLILEMRQSVIAAIDKQQDATLLSDLLLVVLDVILAENEVIYDLSASLDALLKSENKCTKRYYMQHINFCFCEACQVFVGEKGDEYGLLTKLESLTKRLNQVGCQYIVNHIIDDLQQFKNNYCNRDLRNIARHYDSPIKMYEKRCELNNADFFAKGVSHLMAIRMEISVLSSYLITLFAPLKKSPQLSLSSRQDVHLNVLINDTIFKTIKGRWIDEEVQKALDEGQASLDTCYKLYNYFLSVEKLLKERNYPVTEDLDRMKSIIWLRMETLFLRYDVACSVWGYINAASDMERSQNLRLIHISKQAALTHIYGYTEKRRDKSLWTAIKDIDASIGGDLDTDSIENMLKQLTLNLNEDCENSRMFAHYRYKQEFYIPARLKAFSTMKHHEELTDAMELLKVCKSLEDYTTRLLLELHKKQMQTNKKIYEDWKTKIERIEAKVGNIKDVKKGLEHIYNLIDSIYNSSAIS